jgi:hypothetical protein
MPVSAVEGTNLDLPGLRAIDHVRCGKHEAVGYEITSANSTSRRAFGKDFDDSLLLESHLTSRSALACNEVGRGGGP